MSIYERCFVIWLFGGMGWTTVVLLIERHHFDCLAPVFLFISLVVPIGHAMRLAGRGPR